MSERLLGEVAAYLGQPGMLARVTVSDGVEPESGRALTWATLHVATPFGRMGIDLGPLELGLLRGLLEDAQGELRAARRDELSQPPGPRADPAP